MWDQKDCEGYIKTAAVLGAFVDQSISTNTFYNPAHFPGRKVPTTLIAKNLMLAHYWGIKTFYYSLINKAGAKQEEITHSNGHHEQSNGYHIEPEQLLDDDCEACKL
jgi:ribonucleoside-diphosphate reductase alpha chain